MNLRYKSGRYFKFNMHGTFGYNTLNWFGVLYKNKFNIDFLAIPKILWITVSILSTNVFRIYESIRYNKAIKKVVIKEPIFILGYPRSGTTFLHYLLSKDPQFSYCATYQVLMPNLFLSMGNFLEKFLQRLLPKTRLIDNVKMGSMLPKEEEFAMSAISDASMVNGFYFPKNIMKYFYRYVLFSDNEKYEYEWKKKYLFFLKKISLKQPNQRLILKSPFNTGRIKQLLELFPDAKFIHIHRDPYEVYYSNEKLYEVLLSTFSFHKTEEEKIKKFILDSYKFTYTKFFDELSLIMEGNITTVSYENMLINPLKVLNNVYNELDLDNFENARRSIELELISNRNYKTNTHVMDEEVKLKIAREWSCFFNKFGYVPKEIINHLKAV
jgi:hypothetical protein